MKTENLIRNTVKKEKRPVLPDVAETSPPSFSPLHQVGMFGVETQVRVNEDGQEMLLPARIDITVNLIDPRMRGIHMSRIYKIVFDEITTKTLTPDLLKRVLEMTISSQQGISSLAEVRLSFDLPLRSQSLLSKNYGVRHYPIIWEGEYRVSPKAEFFFTHRFKMLYSSTCPCSAALSEDFQNKSDQPFTGFAATPHAQRSEADIAMRFRTLPAPGFVAESIRRMEKVIKTPVQTAVKREDEQEFARLNAENLMFCEDAARILRQDLEDDGGVSDYRIRVSHFESLHAHDAVATVVKGIAGGLVPSRP